MPVVGMARVRSKADWEEIEDMPASPFRDEEGGDYSLVEKIPVQMDDEENDPLYGSVMNRVLGLAQEHGTVWVAWMNEPAGDAEDLTWQLGVWKINKDKLPVCPKCGAVVTVLEVEVTANQRCVLRNGSWEASGPLRWRECTDAVFFNCPACKEHIVDLEGANLPDDIYGPEEDAHPFALYDIENLEDGELLYGKVQIGHHRATNGALTITIDDWETEDPQDAPSVVIEQNDGAVQVTVFPGYEEAPEVVMLYGRKDE